MKKKTDSKTPNTQEQRLINVLYSLEEQLQRQTSLKFVFLRGAIYGLGTVVGATILLALFGGILASTIDTLSDIPFIGQYVDESAVEELQ